MLLLLLLLLLYYRALFDHVSFEKVMYLPICINGKMWFCRFICNYQYSYLRSRCITFLQTFIVFFFVCFLFFFWKANQTKFWISLDTTLFVSHRVSVIFNADGFLKKKIGVLISPLNRLLVYEGSLYQLKKTQQMFSETTNEQKKRKKITKSWLIYFPFFVMITDKIYIYDLNIYI